jgi:hypothetical protein
MKTVLVSVALAIAAEGTMLIRWGNQFAALGFALIVIGTAGKIMALKGKHRWVSR